MVRTNPYRHTSGQTNARTYAHTLKSHSDDYVCLTAASLTKRDIAKCHSFCKTTVTQIMMMQELLHIPLLRIPKALNF